MGQKTSVYLTDEIAARVAASGLTPAELIRRGLDAAERENLQIMIHTAVREELAALLDEHKGE